MLQFITVSDVTKHLLKFYISTCQRLCRLSFSIPFLVWRSSAEFKIESNCTWHLTSVSMRKCVHVCVGGGWVSPWAWRWGDQAMPDNRLCQTWFSKQTRILGKCVQPLRLHIQSNLLSTLTKVCWSSLITSKCFREQRYHDNEDS